MKILIPVLALALIVGLWVFRYAKGLPSEVAATVLHARDGETCPTGFHLVAGVFTEADGSLKDAWVANGNPPMVIDTLAPGESFSIHARLP